MHVLTKFVDLTILFLAETHFSEWFIEFDYADPF